MSYAATPVSDVDNLAAEIAKRFDRDQMDEAACRFMIARILKPAPICPNCKISLSDLERERLYNGKTLICNSCGVKHSLRSGTHINGIHCDYRDIVLVAIMRYWGAPISSISKATNISTATIRRLTERFTFPIMGY